MKTNLQMKHFVLALFFCLLSIISSAAHQAKPYITTLLQFDIPQAYLYAGKLKTSSSGSTQFVCDVTFGNVLQTHGKLLAQVVHVDELNNETPLSDNIEFSTFHIAKKQINAILPAGITTGTICLMYTNVDGLPGPAIRKSNISWELINTYPVAGIPNSKYNSRFVIIGIPERSIFNAGSRVATNGWYRMEFQPDGNLVLYRETIPIWASRKTKGNFDTQVRFYDSGVGCYQGATNYWWDAAAGGSRAIWVLQDDGNFVGYTDYYVDNATGNVVVTGTPFGATMTQNGGQISNRSGRLH